MDILVRVFLQMFAFIDHGNIPKNGLTGSFTLFKPRSIIK